MVTAVYKCLATLTALFKMRVVFFKAFSVGDFFLPWFSRHTFHTPCSNIFGIFHRFREPSFSASAVVCFQSSGFCPFSLKIPLRRDRIDLLCSVFLNAWPVFLPSTGLLFSAVIMVSYVYDRSCACVVVSRSPKQYFRISSVLNFFCAYLNDSLCRNVTP